MKVRVGKYDPDGNFTGEEVEFEGHEIDSWEGFIKSSDPDDQFGATLRLYECPNGYRVHEFLWSLSPDQVSEASLYPVVGHLGYGTYAEQELREKWGDYFPNVR